MLMRWSVARSSRALLGAERPGRRCARGSGTYTQGQSPEPRIREYFYYIDHQGQLFLDDTRVKNFVTCFKDRHFLVFFFSRLRQNESGRYQDSFPFLSLCGRERNFLRCDDRPVVFTQLLGFNAADGDGDGEGEGGGGAAEMHGGREGERASEGLELLSFCGGGRELAVPFRPQALYMHPDSGRLYHPCAGRAGAVGLVRSALAFQLSSRFEYPSGQTLTTQPTHFHWAGERHVLTNELAAHFT